MAVCSVVYKTWQFVNVAEKQGQSPIFTNEVLASASGLEAALYSYADDGIVALGVI